MALRDMLDITPRNTADNFVARERSALMLRYECAVYGMGSVGELRAVRKSLQSEGRHVVIIELVHPAW